MNDEQKKFDNFLELHKDVSKKIGNLPIQRDLTHEISIAFSLNPIRDKDWKIYKKLKPNEKVGFLSRKLLSIARKLDISQANIRRFINTKKDWEWSKKYQTSHKDKEKIEIAVKELYEDKKVEKIKRIFISEKNATNSQRSMFQETSFFVDLIIEKSLEILENKSREI
jgi:hypothetical protein